MSLAGFFFDVVDTRLMRKPRKLIPLWALVIGPFWLPILLVCFLIYSMIFLVWIIPVWLASSVFGWDLPKGLGLDSVDSLDQMYP